MVCLRILAFLYVCTGSLWAAPKNVLLLFPEDMGSHLGILGIPAIETPHLDTLAKDGVLFTQNYCGQPVCSPSKGTIYTGRFPHDNGMVTNVENLSVDKLPMPSEQDLSSKAPLAPIKDEVPTLIEILNQEGYFTGITSKTHIQPMRKFRFDYGWGHIGTKAEMVPAKWRGMLSDFVEKADGQPFFIMANISLPHAPYYDKLKNNNIAEDPRNPLTPPSTSAVDWREIEVPDFLPDTPTARKDLARYYAMVELIDDWTKVLLDELAELGIADDTLIIFTPDHGIAYQRGKNACYPAGTKVPLIIKGPGVIGGLEIDAPVTHADLMPTILEFLNIEAPAIQHGASLWPILRGKQSAITDRTTVLTETNTWYTARAVTDGRWYYVRNYTQPQSPTEDPWVHPPMNIDLWDRTHWAYDNQVFTETIVWKKTNPKAYQLLAQLVEGRLPEEELFDLQNDPWATHNLAEDPSYKVQLDDMRSELMDWQLQTNDTLSDR